jgi:hypothetical protein
MKDQVYKQIELTGTFIRSIEDAVGEVIKHARKTVRNLSWFQNAISCRSGFKSILHSGEPGKSSDPMKLIDDPTSEGYPAHPRFFASVPEATNGKPFANLAKRIDG